MFVLIEGGDASGKTTLINDLTQEVFINGRPFDRFDVVFLKSPTPPFDCVWKELIKGLDNLTRFYLFRTIAQNDSKNVQALLEANKNVVLERNFISTEAFNDTLDSLKNIEDPCFKSVNHINYSGLLKPDIGFFLDVSDDIRELRIQEKEIKFGKRSEWESFGFQTLFNEKLRKIAKREGLQFIDTGLLSRQAVLMRVVEEIQLRHK